MIKSEEEVVETPWIYNRLVRSTGSDLYRKCRQYRFAIGVLAGQSVGLSPRPAGSAPTPGSLFQNWVDPLGVQRVGIRTGCRCWKKTVHRCRQWSVNSAMRHILLESSAVLIHWACWLGLEHCFMVYKELSLTVWSHLLLPTPLFCFLGLFFFLAEQDIEA